MSQSVSLIPLKEALKSLKQALDRVVDDLDRDGAIQRFEYTYELCWKTLKRYFLWNQSKEIDSIKDILREAAQQGLIESLESWFAYHEARNLTSHLYSQKVAEKAFDMAKQFCPEALKLVNKLSDLLKK